MSDSSDTSVEPETPTPSHKRVKCPEKWKKAVAKRKRDSGEEYVSVATKKTVAGRSIGAPCGCPKKCFDLVSSCGMVSRQSILLIMIILIPIMCLHRYFQVFKHNLYVFSSILYSLKIRICTKLAEINT